GGTSQPFPGGRLRTPGRRPTGRQPGYGLGGDHARGFRDATEGHASAGVALFHPNDGSVDYIIIVARISNVFAAHIHCGAPGVAGPVGVTLFMGTPASGPVQGVLVRSSFSTPDPGNACGWTTVADVAAAVASGNAYVNVHTN